MADPVSQFNPSWVTTQLHSLHHVDLHFSTVSATSGQYDPLSRQYLESIGMFAAFVIVTVLLMLLVVSVSFCCACCCLRGRFSRHGHSSKCARVGVAVFAVLTLLCGAAVIGLTLHAAEGVENTQDEVTWLNDRWNTVSLGLEHLSDSAMATSEAVTKIVTSLPASVQSNARDLAQTLQSVGSNAGEIDLPSINASGYYPTKTKEFTWWRIGSIAIGGLLILYSFFALISVWKFRALYGLAAILGCLFVFLCGVVAATEFATSVALADVCYNVTGFITYRAQDSRIDYYIICQGQASPFQSYEDEALKALVLSHSDIGEILKQTNNSVMLQVKRNYTVMSSEFVNLTADIKCAEPHDHFVDAMDDLCSAIGVDLFWMSVVTGAGVLFAVISLLIMAAAWKVLKSRGDYYSLPPTTSWRQESATTSEATPLMQSVNATEAPECTICNDEPVGITFIPCGHTVGKRCGRRPEIINCPMCRKPITSRTDLYFS